MMVLDIEKKLKELGFTLLYDDESGFSYLKKLGKGVAITVTGSYDFTGEFKLLVYDPEMPAYNGRGYSAMGLNEIDLRAMVQKMKEWRKKHEGRTE